ncbi:MAG: Holliday junction branch migration protein RuvA [Clostridia bacterium]|nr:Holliday junction branch migration protein RuvA [Clostridia bacterium]
MFYSLQGTLSHASPAFAVIVCGGVGYKCYISNTTLGALPKVGSNAFLYTHLAVREDAMDLYGFATEAELDFFKLLISVSGVGPKAGLAILSELSPDRLTVAIAAGDAKAIARAKGVGGKTAQRVIIELQGKLGVLGDMGNTEQVVAVGAANASGNAADAVEALTAFGYSKSEAALAVGRLDGTLPTETLIKEALKALAKL